MITLILLVCALMLEKDQDRQLLDALQAYVAQLLDARLDIVPLATQRLPAFIADRYALFEAHILHQRCVLLVPRDDLDDTPGAIAKHIGTIRRDHPDHIVIVIATRISAHNRQRLIAQHVPFIVPGNQMFVPDLAIDLREHFRKARDVPLERLSPAAQMVLLGALRGALTDTTATELAARFRYSVMSMSRAIDELEAAELAVVEVSGKFRHVRFAFEGAALWHRARGLLRSPVRKRRTVRWCKAVVDLPAAGESALAMWTDLAPPPVEVHAIAAADWNAFARANGLDDPPGWNQPQAEVETWSYDPALTGDHRIVDPVSLWLSLPDSSDERFGIAKDQLLKEAGL